MGLRLLLFLPAGLPVRSQGDSNNKQMDNITVRQGETVFLRYTVMILHLSSCHVSRISSEKSIGAVKCFDKHDSA